MDFLEFTGVSFQPDTNVGHLCEELNNIVGKGISYDTLDIRNVKWLLLVNDVVRA
jgi:hypothetical protein